MFNEKPLNSEELSVEDREKLEEGIYEVCTALRNLAFRVENPSFARNLELMSRGELENLINTLKNSNSNAETVIADVESRG